MMCGIQSVGGGRSYDTMRLQQRQYQLLTLGPK